MVEIAAKLKRPSNGHRDSAWWQDRQQSESEWAQGHCHPSSRHGSVPCANGEIPREEGQARGLGGIWTRGPNQLSEGHVKETRDVYSEEEKMCGGA